MQANNSEKEFKDLENMMPDTERESFHGTDIQTPRENKKFDLNLNNKKKFNQDLLKSIAKKTVVFIKKNEFIRVDFVKVLKYSLLIMLIEFILYLTLQLCFSLISSIDSKVEQSSIAIPIAAAVVFIICAIFMIALQMNKNQTCMMILKIFEFISYGICLRKLYLFYLCKRNKNNRKFIWPVGNSDSFA
jgi:hypothetical protein